MPSQTTSPSPWEAGTVCLAQTGKQLRGAHRQCVARKGPADPHPISGSLAAPHAGPANHKSSLTTFWRAQEPPTSTHSLQGARRETGTARGRASFFVPQSREMGGHLLATCAVTTPT